MSASLNLSEEIRPSSVAAVTVGVPSGSACVG